MGARAILVGSSGLVGKHLLELLLDDARFERVVCLVRRPSGRTHAKLEEHVVRFDEPNTFTALLAGDVLFSTLGAPTGGKATEAEKVAIDYTLQMTLAKAARANGVGSSVVVTSAQPDPNSTRAYSRMKGELERDVTALGFTSTTFIRPGLIVGDRGTAQVGERIAAAILNVIGGIGSLKNVRGIHARVIAKAMVAAWALQRPGIAALQNPALFELAGERP